MITLSEERNGQLSNRELRKLAYDIFTKYTGIKVRPMDIILLEADTDGKYIFFKVGKLTFSYMNRLGQDSLAAYPDDRGVDGMIIHSGLYSNKNESVKEDWMSKGKKAKIIDTFKTDDNFFLFELAKDFIGVSVNTAFNKGTDSFLSVATVSADDPKLIFDMIKSDSKSNATWSEIERIMKKADPKYKVTKLIGDDSYFNRKTCENKTKNEARELTYDKVNKTSKTGWSDKFASLLNNLGVSLVFDDGKFFLVDDEGTFSFDDVDGFTTTDEIIDRLSGIIDDFILTDLDDEVEEYSIQFDGDIPNGWEEWDDWAKTADDSEHKSFIKNHQWEFDMMDLLCNHIDEIDLDQFK